MFHPDKIIFDKESNTFLSYVIDYHAGIYNFSRVTQDKKIHKLLIVNGIDFLIKKQVKEHFFYQVFFTNFAFQSD